MTDLPEALPILKHNTNATFGCPSKSDGAIGESADESMTTGDSPRGSRSLLTEGNAKMPTIQQLRWGSSEDAERVAAGAVSATTVEAGYKPPEWRGFDLVVVSRSALLFLPNSVHASWRFLVRAASESQKGRV